MRRLRSPARLIVAAVAVFAAAAPLAVAAGGASASGHATKPTSAGQVDPAALPLGDGYVSSSPKVGYVDSCITNFPSTGGATKDGPWIDLAAGTWNSTTKLAVEGSVSWPHAALSISLSGSHRLVKGNDLPVGHPTGTFPIATSDPAYRYDHNPNRIVAQSIDWTLPANPVAAARPSCTGGGAIGVLIDGVALFNALDGEGRDAGAHEILDRHQGHPDAGGVYHHHEVPAFMIDAARGASTLVGYALDGYGIYVERDASGRLLTNTDLDACHGRTSRVTWNGRLTEIYHYDATLEYPYTVGCFHATPIHTSLGGGAGGPP